MDCKSTFFMTTGIPLSKIPLKRSPEWPCLIRLTSLKSRLA
uniref:Uncharacterized protein n=1 Tax=Rhizophora mucronata TaxID=61149 RepID=A0A2P2QE10_RHIMU